MSAALDIIRRVSETGARLVLVNGGVGFDKPIPAELLTLARQCKDAIREALEAQTEESRAEGLKRLEAAARGLPATLDELAEFFRDDLPDFASGAVKPEGIRLACECVVLRHWGRHPYWDHPDRKPKPPPKEEYRRSIR